MILSVSMLFTIIILLALTVLIRRQVVAAAEGKNYVNEDSDAGLDQEEDNVRTGSPLHGRHKPIIEYLNASLIRYTFGTCGGSGRLGPTQHQCDIAYQSDDRPQVFVGNDSMAEDEQLGRIPPGVQVWMVPETANYSITAIGASGGTSLYNADPSQAGYVHAKFELKKNDILYILVGQRGESLCAQSSQARSETLRNLCVQGRPQELHVSLLGGGAGGGGGASYVFKVERSKNWTTELLLVAGGGGGRSVRRSRRPDIADGGKSQSGLGTSTVVAQLAGGHRRPGAGGGWFFREGDRLLMDGQGLVAINDGRIAGQADGGLPCTGAAEFGTTGGFGGGGGSCSAGGGGGGFTGGDASLSDSSDEDGKGGSSYINRKGMSPKYVSGVREGDGAVEILKDLTCPCKYLCMFIDVSSQRFQCYCPLNYQLDDDGLTCFDPTKRPPRRSNTGIHVLVVLAASCVLLALVVCAALIIVRRKRRGATVDLRAKSEQLLRLHRRSSPSSLSTLSRHHRVVDHAPHQHAAREPRWLFGEQDCPLDPGGRSFVTRLEDPDAEQSSSGDVVVIGGILTEYNPTYDYGGTPDDESCKGLGSLEPGVVDIPVDRLQLIKLIGKGEFGEVFQGKMKFESENGQTIELLVAAKTLSGMSSKQAELDFLLEALIMSKFNHPNIVRFIGVCFKHCPRLIVLELLEGGDLKTFLRHSRPSMDTPCSLTLSDLVRLSLDVAKGCEYLEQNRFIHRDIAARNCLLTCKGHGRIAKIADFGMARDIYSADYYRNGGRALLPVKWMPPEAFLDGIFTSKTDVWSFGVLTWEVFSLGYVPYPGCGNQEVMHLVADGGRLNPPAGCPATVYDIMTSCWHTQPSERPAFSTIISQLCLCLADSDVSDIVFSGVAPATFFPPTPDPGLSTDEVSLDDVTSSLTEGSLSRQADVIENDLVSYDEHGGNSSETPI